MLRATFQFSLMDLMIATPIVAVACQETRASGLTGSVMLGAVLFALWWLCRLIHGLVGRTHDDRSTEIFFYTWIIKYVVVVTVICGVAYGLRSLSLWD